MDSEGIIVALARDKIDAEITALKERIRALRTERNRLAPISRLSQDILAQIFAWLQQLDYNFKNSGQFPSKWVDRPKGYPTWTTATHVCQHWRQIALSSSSKSLRDLISSNIPYAARAFKGSQSPWYLIECRSRTWTSTTMACRRVRFLRNSDSGSHLAGFNEPMPLLEHVEIRVMLTNTDPDPCILSPFIISPSLRILELSRCDFTWDWPALPHLTTLKIEDPVQKVSLNTFLLILFGSPHLEHLTIDNISPASADSQPHAFKLVTPSFRLPGRLSSLRTRKCQFSAQLFTHLRFTEDFSVHLDAEQVDADSVPLIMQVINCVLSESSKTIRFVYFSAWEAGFSLGLSQLRGYFLSLTLDPRHQGERDLSRCGQYLSMLPLNQLEKLEISVLDDPVHWKESGLGQLPNLRHIDFGLGPSAEAFLRYLARDYEQYKKARGHQSFSFTSLHEVYMDNIHFTRELKTLVYDALAGRNRAGYRLKTFHAGYCTGETTTVVEKQLKKYVDDVSVTPVPPRRGYR
ncbi:hypothetical protein BDN72DRAFT_851300 [Pluteus cervinus]|uniref:Uncharacterized protein n=1 Tax=Pluteus cervinus TaxID=181527 RepID=A0ACD3A1Z8_9AGAR|nr:hypothetical protein BDN72DRAFT_851300 [Pluteus cervinus]